MNPTYEHGWFQVAFEKDLCQEITPAVIGARRLVLIRANGKLRAADANCPHRGAHLGYGGRLDGDAIVCPFHGLRISLDACAADELKVSERAVLAVGGLVFVRLSECFDNGVPEAFGRLEATHVLVPGYDLQIRAPAALIVENGFDQAHFHPVHGVRVGSFSMRAERDSSLFLASTLLLDRAPELREDETSKSASAKGLPVGVPITLRAFSPGLSILDVGGGSPYTMIIAATPTANGDSTLRVSLALPREAYGEQPSRRAVDHLLENSRLGIEADRTVWEHINPAARPKLLSAIDAPVLQFRAFCAAFEQGPMT